jgi:hypothetical protein
VRGIRRDLFSSDFSSDGRMLVFVCDFQHELPAAAPGVYNSPGGVAPPIATLPPSRVTPLGEWVAGLRSPPGVTFCLSRAPGQAHFLVSCFLTSGHSAPDLLGELWLVPIAIRLRS